MNIAGDLLMEQVVGIAVVIIMLETADGETESLTEWFVNFSLAGGNYQAAGGDS